MKAKIILFIVFLAFLFCGQVPGLSQSQSADDYFNKASAQYIMGNYEGTIGNLRAALEIDPNHRGARELLKNVQGEAVRWLKAGKKYYSEGKPEKAEEEFKRVLLALPDQKEAAEYLAKIGKERGGAPGFRLPGLVVIGLPVLAALAVCLAVALFIRRWWKSKRVLCMECNKWVSSDMEFCPRCGSRLKSWDVDEVRRRWFAKYNWRENPFTLDVIPTTFAGHRAEVAKIMEKLSSRSGHVLVIGGLGSGKTMFLRWLEKNLKEPYNPIYIIRPPHSPNEVITLVMSILSSSMDKTRSYTMYEFQNFCGKYKGVVVLLLDEAHEFNEEFEKFLRTTGDMNNVFLVMAGLPQQRERLKRECPALFDRIVETIFIGALSREETSELIMKRISYAGGSGVGPFVPSSLEKIHELSLGIPRMILKIADWVVTQAIVSDKNVIDAEDVAGFKAVPEARNPLAETVKGA